jgi:hypothetical protein
MTKTRPPTEEQWLGEQTPQRLVLYLQQLRRVTEGPGSRRKVRLFKIACCRLIWDQLSDERSRHVIEVCESHVEEQARRTDLAATARAAGRAVKDAARKHYHEPFAPDGTLNAAVRLSSYATAAAHWAAYGDFQKKYFSTVVIENIITLMASREPDWNPAEHWSEAHARAAGIVANLVRCIFSNPFRAAAIDEAWSADKGSTVARMARAIYDERAFDRLPVLSDALEEAGCTDAAILKHCREDRHHARGCWVVDALLGKR